MPFNLLEPWQRFFDALIRREFHPQRPLIEARRTLAVV